MLIDLVNLSKKHNLSITGVVQIGAHYGEEDVVYDKLNIAKRMYFEPIKSSYDILVENTNSKFCEYHNVALGDQEGNFYMNLSSNRNASASILKPKNHLKIHRNVKFDGVERVLMKKLDSYNVSEDYNFMNIDVQGYELKVLKGAKRILNHIDYIMCEINRDEVYEGCAHLDSIIEFLEPYGFKIIEVNWAGGQWGDGFFIKEKINETPRILRSASL